MKIPRQLQPAVDFAKELAKEFNEDNGALMAAAVSFFIFLSMTPLLLLAAATLGFVLGSDQEAFRTVAEWMGRYLPEEATGDIRPILEEIVRGSTAATGFGILALLWAGSQALVNLEIIMSIAWDTQPRGFLKSRLVAVGLLVLVGLLLLLSFAITTAASAITARDYVVFGENISEWFGSAWGIVAYLLPTVVSIVTFTLIYKILPNAHVPNIPALAGGVVAGLLWEMAKVGFSWYVTNISNYNAVYGPLSSIIVLLFWIYYSALITILGAQIASIYHKRRGESAEFRVQSAE